MNAEWLGLLLPISMLILVLTYLVFFPMYISRKDEGQRTEFDKFLIEASPCSESFYAHRICMAIVLFMTPIILLGFVFGKFQTSDVDKSLRCIGYFIGFLYVIFLFGLFKYYFG